MLDSGEAQLEFMGVIAGLVHLKNELSFVLKIDNDNFSKNGFNFNYEIAEHHKIPLAEFENFYESESRNKIFNHPSALLYTLLKENHLYREALSGA